MDRATLQAKLGALTPEQQEQLKKLLAAKRDANAKRAPVAATPAEGAIPRVPDAEDYALSFAQKRLWMQEELSEGGSAAYNVPLAVFLRGELDVAALEIAFRSLMERHAVLRTRFVRRNGEPRQVIVSSPEWAIERWAARESASAPADFHQRAEEMASRPFALERELPFRAAVMPLGPQSHGLAMTFHHIACDGRSVATLIAELEHAYVQATRRDTTARPAPKLRYVDYAAWHREWMASPAGTKAKHYWLQQFSEIPEPLELPGDFPRPSVQDFSGRHLYRKLPAGTRERIAEVGQRVGASLFGTLLGAVVTFLHRYAGRDDITVGSPVEGRPHAELDELVGFFVNTLPLRTKLTATDSFLAVVERVRDGVLDAVEHQGCPFDVMVQSLPLERDLSRPPLFTVMMGLTRAQEETLRLPGVRAEVVPLGLRTSKVDLTFHFVETAEGLELDLEYATALFSETRMQRLAECFETMLGAALAMPAGVIGDLGLLSPAQVATWLKTANPPPAAYPHDRSLASLFREQVARDRDAPAVAYDGKTFTYAELDRLSDAIAGHLVGRLGALRVDEPIALQVDRSERMLAALLGILKAGGCYLPINPGTPLERVRTLLTMSGARLRLTEGEPAVPGWNGSDVDLRTWCSTPPPVTASSGVGEGSGAGRRLAYIIFTSGSTGEPKGVLIEQHSVVRLVRNTDYLQLGPNDRMLQTGSLAFDASTFEIWGPLLNGGCCCLPRGKEILEIDQFGALVKATGATTCFLTTGLFNQIADFNPEAFRELKHLLTGGEKVSVPHVNRVLAAAPHLTVLHVYGPTENTTFSTWYRIAREHRHDVPIGRPLAHSTIYILDERGNVQPPGVVGEIYCGGDGIARGYLGRLDATADRFVPDPFSGRPGTRLYRTGDFGRWDEAGNVEFAGRRDDQVKIRGFRIELGEVELRLRAQPGVQQAVVVARPAGGTHELVAYLVAPGLASEETLRAGLAKVLPDYMVPSYFVLLDALPLNASGKVNRKALPAPRPSQPETGATTRFADPKEQALAAAWTDVLGRAPANADAHYFNSGGDSIKAIQMTARLRTRGYRLTLRDVFGRPRFADLAAALVAGETAELDTVADTGEAPFTPIQRWFLATYAPPYDHFNQATLLESDERLRPDLLRKALQQLVDRHGMLRCRVERAEVAGGWKQTVPPGPGAFLWREDDLSAGSPEAAEAAYEAATTALQRGLSLTEGRLVAAGLFRTAKTDRLLLVIHHWAVDGISWRILVGELETIYRALLPGTEPALAKPSAFRAWAQLLVNYGKSEALAREARYWEEVAKRIPRAEPAPVLATTDRQETVFAADVTQRLLTEAHRAYGTQVGELLLAAFGQAWTECRGDESVALAMEGHGRESCVGSVDASTTVGWFTSMWPFVLTGAGDWSERIRTVKDTLRAVPERGVGYGVLRYLQGRMAEAAVPRVSFNYLGVFEAGSGALFRGVVGTPTGDPTAAHLRSPFDLDVVGEVSGGCLHVGFHFHRSAQTSEQRAQLVAAFRRAVEQGVAEGCQAAPQPSISDFTGGVNSLAEVDRLLRRCAQHALGVEDILPLTPMQEGMVFHALYEPHSAAYSDQVVLRLRGAVDAKIFAAAWQALGQQYPNLRATFLTGETERPVGVIARGSTLGFTFVVARDDAEVAARRAEERTQKFDLATGPLLRLTLVTLAPDEHEAILGFHHSILDGWSSGLIWQRLEENYRALAAEMPVPAVRGAYRDFLRWLRARDTARDLADWSAILAGAPAGVAVPTGAPRLGAPAVRTRSYNWEMGRERTERFVTSARRLGTTENSLFQTLWGIFLGKLTRRSDVVFGATVSGRTEGIPRVEEIVGLLINTIPVRVAWQENTTFQELAERLRAQSAEGMERLSVSLADIQTATGATGSVVQHTLVFENYPDSNPADTLWRMETVEVHDPMHFEFGLLVVPKREGWICRVVADEARYPDAYLKTLQQTWHEVVDHYLGAPQNAVEGWEPAISTNQLRRIAVAATFTAEPLEDALRFWLQGRGEEADVRFAPFNQVLQELLNPEGDLLRARADLNVLLVRLEDWAGSKRGDALAVEESLDLNADHFIDGLQRLVQTAPNARNLVLFCPASPEAQRAPVLGELLAAAERRLLRRIDVARLKSVRGVASRELTGRFAGACIDNPGGDALGGVPYAEQFFAVLASEAIRRWDALTRAPFKVLALDADQTLWSGVLGEDGVEGIELTAGHRRLQEVAKAARAGGMLLTLVTKNNLDDVKEAFRVRKDLPLAWDDFVAVEAHWQPKSESLRALARNLNLGLDSFVFLDDSSLECAEVRAALPDVLTLQVPADPEAIERFAAHLWPADVFAASAEDQQRSALYQVESRRQAARASSSGLKDFVRQLELVIDVVAVNDANLERAAQLTQRTNQFNASTVRRSEAEIREFLARPGSGGFLLEVRDRFGEYGLTGFVLYADDTVSRTVDTFLLSCRVLGRGVEHELLRRLGREAAERGLKTVRVSFARTAKNAPAEQFLRACAGRDERDAAGVGAFVFEVAAASRVEMANGTAEAPAADTIAAPPVARPAARSAASYFYQTVATDLASPSSLLAAVEVAAQRGRQRRSAAVYEAPRDGVERLIADIWTTVLGVARVGRQDDFFALGGHSLKAVMMLSRVNRALGAELLLETIFATPVLADFAARVGSSTRAHEARRPIPRVADATDYPLSDAQRRLWLIEQMRTDPPSPFHMAAVFSLRGPLDEARLTLAFRRVIERHESLRTGLLLVGNEPRQRVFSQVEFSIEPLAANALPEFLEREFDLARPPLLRAALHREGEQRWTLAVVMHHAISDGWSIGVIAEELSRFYADRQFAPEPLPIQYRDYAVWQERQLAEGKWQHAADYWRQLFRELPSPLELPTDRSRPAIKQSRGADVSATLPLATWCKIKQDAQQTGASPFVALLAVLQVLLARQARAQRFVIGTPVAGREAPELEPQVGFFVNLLPIVAEVEGARSFSRHLSAVKDSVASALSHAAYPFDRLVNDLVLPRDMSRAPLFDVLLVFQSNRDADLSLGNVQLETVPRPSQTSQYDLTFELVETTAGLWLRLEYATALFDAPRMQRMAEQFVALLENAFAHPTQAVEALELCSSEERDLIRRFERGSRFGTSVARTIPQLVHEAGKADPSRVAVAVADRTMTYAELDRRTRAIAAAVHAAGAAAQELIAVAGERSEHFICAMLGVMRAGCVYVPLDLKHPDERLRMVIEDGAVRRALAIGAEAEQRMQGLGLALIAPAKAPEAAERDESATPDDLAYVIFTSGSTGRPKGVEITHASFATMIESQVRAFGVQRNDRCAWWASCAFDASLSEIFLGLTTGATVVIAETAEREDPTAFLEWLERQRVTVITLPPAFLRVLDRTSLEPVRVLITAGEAADAGDLLHYAQGMHVFNAYGPTETSVCASIQRVEKSAGYDRTIPIGQPLDVAAAYVLDARRRRVPLGVPGELFVGGRIVGRGYRGAASLTGERFLLDPFAEVPGARMYRTGDLVRWRDDGALEFLGREDAQVKIRGFRIELGEVESALRQIAGVRAAAVLAVDRLGAKALIAYVAVDAIGLEDLRAAVAERLPDYMRPAAYCLLERLPTTANGKLDKAALPAPDWAGSDVVTAPETERERVLAAAWAAALGLARIGRESNFFSLGGDSIKALTLAAKLRTAGWELGLKLVFAHPVLSEQALALRPAAAAKAREVSGPVMLTPIQKWFLEAHAGAPLHHFNQALFYRAAERVDLARLQQAVTALWVRHAALRATFVCEAGEWRQIIQPATEPAPDVQRLDVSADPAAHATISAWVETMQSGPKLETGPLVRYGLIREAAGDRVLCVTHHLVSDWVSHRILIEDMATAYGSNGGPSTLPPPGTELDEWTRAGAAWANDSTRRDALIQQWKAIAQSAPSIAVESSGRYGEVAVIARELSGEATAALRQIVARQGTATLRDVILAGMVRAERTVFGRERLAVQLEGHGRDRGAGELDVSRTVGWFTSLYPCVFEARATSDDVVAIGTVSEALAALPDAGASYSLLRAYGPNVAKGPALAVKTTVGFNFLGEFMAGPDRAMFAIADELPAVTIAPDFPRDHPLDVTAWIFDGRLHVQCAFIPSSARREAMERWLDHVTSFLRRVAGV